MCRHPQHFEFVAPAKLVVTSSQCFPKKEDLLTNPRTLLWKRYCLSFFHTFTVMGSGVARGLGQGGKNVAEGVHWSSYKAH